MHQERERVTGEWRKEEREKWEGVKIDRGEKGEIVERSERGESEEEEVRGWERGREGRGREGRG